MSRLSMGALGFEVFLGSLTFTGSLMAFGKLQGLIPGAPVTYKGQNFFNVVLFGVSGSLIIYWWSAPGSAGVAFYRCRRIGLLLGVLAVLPIGGADMPVVISLLNSYAGLAAVATGVRA